MRHNILKLLAIGLLPTLLSAQTPTDTLNLADRNLISVGIGLTGVRDARVDAAGATTHNTGELGYIGFSRYVRPQVAIDVSVATLNADAGAQASRTYANAVTSVLFGVRYSPRPLALTPTLRPFVSLSAGPYIHSASNISLLGSVTATAETAPGARLGAGADWFVARHFMLRAEGNYHAVGAFDHPSAFTERASGFGFGVGMGFVWGGR